MRSAAAKPRSGRPHGSTEKARSGPHRRFQLLAWFFVVTVFCGLALLSGNGLGLGGHSRASTTAAASSSGLPTASVGTPTGTSAGSVTVVSVPSDVNGQVLAAGSRPHVDGVDTSGVCSKYDEQRDFLPLNRWTSFGLFTVDNAWIMKTRLFVSMIAGLLFMAAGLVWRLIGTLMGFGYTFDMVCWAAPGINTAVHDISMWASWFLIPVWLFVLTAVVKRWNGGKNGPAAAMRLLMVFLTATGMIFFIGDQSAQHVNDPTAKYTVPWMAKSVQGWFGQMSRSLTTLTDLGTNRASAFYDSDPTTAGNVTCVKLDKALYDRYAADNNDTAMSDGIGGMQQISKIWEITMVRSWVAAQFGDGTKDYPSPAHAACRDLEANSNVDLQKKLEAYDLSTGNKPNTTTQGIKRGYFISPTSNEQVIMVAWGACMSDNGRESKNTIPQWDKANGMDGKADGCAQLYSSDKAAAMGNYMADLITGAYKINKFYFNGSDELNSKLGDCVASDNPDTARACRADWDFVSGWLGANQAERITQGLLSIVVAIVFLFALGPMAIGLTLTSVALAALCMILPLSLILTAAGVESGKKALKATGATAGAKAVFTLAMAFLTDLIDLSYSVVQASIGSNSTPNFFEQVLEGSTPLLALLLFRKGAKWLGLGDLSKMTGALGFAGAAMLKATGDKDLSRGAADRISRGLGRIGVGDKRLSKLDEKSLQRRMLNNKATRAVGNKLKAAGKKAVVDPVAAWTKDKYGAARAAVVRKRNDLIRKAKSGSPAQRAAAYAAIAASGVAATAMLPAATVAGAAVLPAVAALGAMGAMTAAGAAALGKTAQHANGRLKDAARLASLIENGTDGSLKPGAAAGVVTAKNSHMAKRQADLHHRNIIRVNDKEEKRALTTEYVVDGVNAARARQWGGGSASGINTAFKGFANEAEKERALDELVNKTGLARDQIMLGNHGLWLPKLVSFDPHTGERRFDQGAPLEALAHPVNLLDRRTLEQRPGESNDDYIARQYAHMRERGAINNEGEAVNMLTAMKGIDTRTPEGRERAVAFFNGAQDEELSNFYIRPRRSEDAAVRASREWVQDQRITTHNLNAVEVMTAARDDISDYKNIKVVLPSGGTGTAQDVQIELDQKFDAMKSIVLKIGGLHQQIDDAHRNSASSDPAEFHKRIADLNKRLADMQDLQRARAQEIDELTKLAQDTFDASSSARTAWKVWATANDPATDMDDLDAVKREIEQYTADMQARQEARRQEMERLVGAIYRMPSNASGAGMASIRLDDLRKKLAEQTNGEEIDNFLLLRKVEDIERELERQAASVALSPRTSPSNHPKMRELLDAMYEELHINT
ncbi:hypothetical protein AB0L00_26070 [Actinoallomurus sp. NPDC052308]|uniref:hypothetical protein n=1 Tax=Actinoallomurus sp. NPDC052308 TaxID=3155530 RepID=UPI0034301025